MAARTPQKGRRCGDRCPDSGRLAIRRSVQRCSASHNLPYGLQADQLFEALAFTIARGEGLKMQFTRLTLDARPVWEAAVKRFPMHSDFNFTSLFCWNLDESTQVALGEDGVALDIRAYHGEGRLVSFMAQTNPLSMAIELVAYTHRRYGSATLQLIPDWMVPSLAASVTVEDRDHADYLYAVDSLRTLRGNTFRGKGARARRFAAANKPRVRELNLLEAHDRTAVLEFFDAWATRSSQPASHKTDEHKAFERLLEHASKLPVEGIAVEVSQSIVAFMLFEVATYAGHQICMGHFQKANLAYFGVTEFLMRELATMLQQRGIALLNGQQDLGLPDLRRAKQGYRPVGYLRKFTVSALGTRSPSDDAAKLPSTARLEKAP